MFYINKTRNAIKKNWRKFKQFLKNVKPFLRKQVFPVLILAKKNLLKYYKIKILKEKRFIYKSVKDLPTRVRIDACNYCQLDCVQCPVKIHKKKIEENAGFGYLKFSNFKKFVDENSYIKEIELSNNGEIFLNPELNEIIKYAYEKNIDLYACNGVNLNTLSEETAEYLVKYGVKRVVVSIDAATPETYPIYQKGGDFNKVIENVKKINYYKEKYNSKLPELVYKFIVFGHNEHEIPLAKEIAASLNMRVTFFLNWNAAYSPIKDPEFVERETGLPLTKNIKTCDKLSIEKYKEQKDIDKLSCGLLFNAPQIDWNGNFLGCCATSYKDFGGNVFKDGFLKVLNSENVLYAKGMLTELNLPPKDNIPCTSCVIYQELKGQIRE